MSFVDLCGAGNETAIGCCQSEIKITTEKNPMPNVIVEPNKENGGYHALQNGRVVAEGKTQQEAGDKAHERRPYDTIEAARVRDLGAHHHADLLRVLHHPSKTR
jgi:hypothetical protein